ncbi:hypothetical protein K8S19_05330 [bacterium]|nr:hypothetical protein [bacterium]
MRNKNILLGLIVIVPLLSSCASVGLNKSTVNPIYLQQLKKIAVMTVYCDKRIDTSELTSIVFDINKRSNQKNFDLFPMAMKLHKTIFTLYPSILPSEIADEKSIIMKPHYRAIKKNENFFLKPFNVATPPGYIAISTFDLNPIKASLEQMPDIDGVLFLSAEYRLSKIGGEFLGFGKLAVKCTVTLSILDREGNVAINHSVEAESMSKIKYSFGGAFDTAKIIPLCDEATEQADLWMQYWLKKNVVK